MSLYKRNFPSVFKTSGQAEHRDHGDKKSTFLPVDHYEY